MRLASLEEIRLLRTNPAEAPRLAAFASKPACPSAEQVSPAVIGLKLIATRAMTGLEAHQVGTR